MSLQTVGRMIVAPAVVAVAVGVLLRPPTAPSAESRRATPSDSGFSANADG